MAGWQEHRPIHLLGQDAHAVPQESIIQHYPYNGCIYRPAGGHLNRRIGLLLQLYKNQSGGS